MNTQPTTWKELLEAPEVAKDFKGKIIGTVEYCRKPGEPNVPFVPILYKTQLDSEDSKWYISHATFSNLRAYGHRANCMIETTPNTCYVWDYESTKKYADWYFSEKRSFIFDIRDKFQYHIVLLFFCNDEKWAPFHHDFIKQKPCYVKLMESSTTILEDDINKIYSETKKIFIFTQQKKHSIEEISFIRVLIALAVLRNKLLDKNAFLDTQLKEYKEMSGYDMELSSSTFGWTHEYFCNWNNFKSPILKPLIYRYFFSLNNLEGVFVRKALLKYKKLSLFIIIYRFLRTKKMLIHFDEIILKEAREYVSKIKELGRTLGDLLPYAELLAFNFTASVDNWKYLARVSLLSWLRGRTDIENHWGYQSLKNFVYNYDEKFKLIEKDVKNEVYLDFDKLDEVYRIMATTLSDNILELEDAKSLCIQLLE